MDSEHNHTEPAADNMQVEMDPIAIAEQSSPIDEIEMQLLDDSAYSIDDNMADMETATTSTTVPATPLSTSLQASSSSAFPSALTSRRTSMRRTRVEEDHDDERDRRHPSQRVGSPSHPSNSTGIRSPSPSPPSQPVPNQPSEISSPRPSIPASLVNPRPFRFFQHLTPPNLNLNSGPSSPSQPVNPSAQDVVGAAPAPIPVPAAVSTATGTVPTPTPSNSSNSSAGAVPRRVSQYIGGFSFTLNTNSGMTNTPIPRMPLVPFPPPAHTDDATPVAPPPDGATPAPGDGGETQPAEGHDPELPQAQAASQSQTDGPPPQPHPPPGGLGNGGPTSFADILARISLLAALSVQNSGLFERDVDDPERAKRLVEGLEDVPIGLVRRLERVGEVGGGEEVEGVGDAGAGVGGLGDGGCAICWERLLVEAEEAEEGKAEEGETKLDAMDGTQTQPAEPSSTASKKDGEKQFQRIVTLPCAHVFHASCLIPWFSKPKQTTCPICRFNIDPENLTYTSRAQRRARAQEAGEAGGDAGRGTAAGGEESEGQTPPGLGDLFGFNIPIVIGGPPFVIPVRPGAPNAAHPGAPAPVDTAAGSQPAANNGSPTTNNANGNAGNNANDAAGNATNPSVNAGTNEDRASQDVMAFVEVYVGHGQLPPSFRGPGVTRIHMPGAPSAPPSNDAANNTDTNGAASTGAANANVSNPFSGGAFTTPANPQAGASEAAAGGNEGGRTRGTAFAIPMTQGIGRAFGDIFSRIFGGAGPSASSPAPGTNTTGTAGAPTGRDTGGQGSGPQPQGPVVFGPERPPAPSSTSIPLGLGASPMMFPFGMRGAGANGMTTQQRQGEQPGQPGHGQASRGQGGAQQGLEHFPLFDIIGGMLAPPATPAADQGQPQARADVPPPQPRDTAQFLGGGLGGGGGFSWTFGPGSPPPRPSEMPGQQQERKQWAPPPAPGLTLRQRVEKKEQEAGLRCCDVSCGVGPSDEDPWVDVSEEALRQLCIRPSTPHVGHKTAVDVGTADGGADLDGAGEGSDAGKDLVCPHTFHSSCLVSSERVSLALRNTEVAFVGPEGKEVEVTCPVCRGVGRVSKDEWDAGVLALA